jgi:hypothetical protein
METIRFTTTPAFDAGLRGLIEQCGLNARQVVARETGELIKTLVRFSPPANPPKTREAIRQTIRSKFALAGDSANSERGGQSKPSASGVRWLYSDPNFLYGVAPELDQRKAGILDLESMLYRLTSKGAIVAPFQHPRRRQRVKLWQTILTKKKTLNALIAKKVRAVGRLKAGWLVAVNRGAVTMTGAIPQWISRHATGARGRFVNGLALPSPRFEVANSAKGIGAPFLRYAINSACKIRAKAMQANALLFMRGKKNLADYAK